MKYRERVLNLLKERPELRSDDKRLTYEIYQQIAKENGRGIYIPFDLWKKFPAFETIKRTRAKIQNEEGLYLSDSPIMAKGVRLHQRAPLGGEKKEIKIIPSINFPNTTF